MEQEVIEEVDLFEEDGQPESQAVEAAPQEEEAPAFEIPEKFRDKSMEDVIQSYVNLEKEYGNKSNEVGELRKLTDQILLNQAQQQQAQTFAPAVDINEEVGFDDFIEDPTSAVNRALAHNPTIQKMEQELTKQQTQLAREALLSAHPDADSLVQSPEFTNWVQQSPGRLRMLQQADATSDVDVAVDLLNLYKQTQKITNEEAVTERNAKAKGDLRKATVETGSAGGTSRKKVFKRSELIELKIRDPQRYEAMREEIMQAYAEKRVK